MYLIDTKFNPWDYKRELKVVTNCEKRKRFFLSSTSLPLIKINSSLSLKLIVLSYILTVVAKIYKCYLLRASYMLLFTVKIDSK